MFKGPTSGTWRSPGGFTLVEMMLVVAVAAILAAMAIPVSAGFLSVARADSSVSAAVATLNMARDRSVAERRNFEVSIVDPNRIQITRDEQPAGQTLIADIALENGQQFIVFDDVPDTPDAFGKSSAFAFTGTGPWMFTSDGSLIDSNGDVANGTIFLGVPNKTETARAVTIFGVTGMMKAWKWRGNRWFE